MNLTRLNPFRSAVAAAFPVSLRTDAQLRADATLGAAFARRLGTPTAPRPRVDIDDVPHPVNRQARRKAGARRPLTPAELAAHPHPTYRKKAPR